MCDSQNFSQYSYLPGKVWRQGSLAADRVGLPGRGHHLPARLHPGLHQFHRGDYHRHHHRLPPRGERCVFFPVLFIVIEGVLLQRNSLILFFTGLLPLSDSL